MVCQSVLYWLVCAGDRIHVLVLHRVLQVQSKCSTQQYSSQTDCVHLLPNFRVDPLREGAHLPDLCLQVLLAQTGVGALPAHEHGQLHLHFAGLVQDDSHAIP